MKRAFDESSGSDIRKKTRISTTQCMNSHFTTRRSAVKDNTLRREVDREAIEPLLQCLLETRQHGRLTRGLTKGAPATAQSAVAKRIG